MSLAWVIQVLLTQSAEAFISDQLYKAAKAGPWDV